MTSQTSQDSVDVNEERPWLSLLPFTEATQRFFFGRDEEIRDVFLRVREHPLTVLYGPSGLGKTSLLGAGLMPKLRAEGYRPMLVRLAYEEGAPPLVEQVSRALDGLFGTSPAAGVASAPQNAAATTLWERLHDRRLRPAELAAAPPVLVFDQLEEIFTLTEQFPARKREAAAFFEELADLVENRPPASLQRRLRADRALARELDFTASPARVVLTLREDYLSHLEVWKKALPALMRNRMALNPLTGPHALDAVVKPGRLGGSELVSEEVGRRIVCFVAKQPSGTPLDEIRAVPPLLSLLCYELNEARLAASPPAASIGVDEVDRQGADILQNFYDRSFAGLPVEVRRFVEDWLITVGGHRNAVAREDALAELRDKGIPDAGWALDQLVNGRLLSAEDRSGIQRLEITHDVLAPLAVLSRDRRRERERAERAEAEQQEARERVLAARRQRTRLRWIIAAVSVAAAAAVVAASLAVFSARRATAAGQLANALVDEASRKAVGAAHNSFARGDSRAGLAYLAEALRYRPENERIRAAAASYLVQTPIVAPLPIGSPMRHKGPIEVATFSPDSRRVLTASDDGTAQVWDAASGRPLGPPLRHDEDVLDASFSPDGGRVVTASVDGTARIWEAANARPIGAPLRHDGPVRSAAFSPDGRLVLTVAGGRARLWDAATAQPIGIPLGSRGQILAASFSPDGRSILTAGLLGATLWDAASGAPAGSSVGEGRPAVSAAFSPDGRWILTGGAGEAQVWDVTSGQAIGPSMRHSIEPLRATFSPDGRRVLTAGDDAVGIWDMAGGEPAVIRHDGVKAAGFSADGRWVVTAGADNDVRFWDAASGRDLGVRLNEDAAVSKVSFSADGRWVLTASGNTARVWNAAIGRAVAERIREDDAVNAASFSPDGRWLLTGGEDGVLRVRDAARGLPVGPPILTGSAVETALFSADGRWILTAGRNGTARVWAATSGHPAGPPIHSQRALENAAFSPDGRFVVTTLDDGVARVWDSTTGKPIGQPMKHGGLIVSAAFSNDGSLVATASDHLTARVWEASTGQPAAGPFRHRTAVQTASFSPDGSWLATGTADGTAAIWDVASGETLGAAMKHDRGVVAASFSPDGRLLATADASDRALVQLWRAPSGALIGTPMKHGGRFIAATFSPDSRLLLTASADGVVRVWGTALGRLLGAPMKHPGVSAATWSPDGRWILTAGYDGVVRMWEAPRPDQANDAYLAFEVLGGQRVSDDGLMIEIPLAERLSSRVRLRALDSAAWDQLVDWCLADPRTRTVSPHATIAVPEQIEREIDWVMNHPDAPNAPEVLDAAYALDPSHPLILLALAAQKSTPEATRDLYVKLGRERLPADPRLRARADEILRSMALPETPLR